VDLFEQPFPFIDGIRKKSLHRTNTMSQAISAVEARQKLGEILNRVSLRGEEIIIERAGKKIARLSPIENEKPQPQGRLDFRKAAGLGKDIWKNCLSSFTKQELRPLHPLLPILASMFKNPRSPKVID
jgi:prevent-host-death family protein